MENKPLSLLELNSLVRRSITSCLPDEYWVQAELSDVRVNYSGHCYLEFVQKDATGNALLAKARGIIWANVFTRLRSYFERETGQGFVSGLKVLVKVMVDFHELYGYSLTVVNIDPTYTLGDMVRRRKEILRQLDEEGILTLNKELELPVLTQRIAVISSATAAGYGDFCNQLLHNSFGFVFYPRLFQAIMQGEQVEQSIIQALDRINATRDNWDVVVIITGIGHERDDTVLDMISHTRVKTPTAAAEFLINHVRQTAQELEAYEEVIYQEVPRLLQQEKQRLDSFVTRIPGQVQMRGFRDRCRCGYSGRISVRRNFRTG